MNACRTGQIDLAELAIAKGAYDLHNALSWACYENQIPMVIYILGKGEKDVDTALGWACRNQNVSIIQYVIQKGANDWNHGLSAACESGNINAAKIMLDRGASNFNRGLVSACAYKQVEMVKYMLKHGANDYRLAIEWTCLLSEQNKKDFTQEEIKAIDILKILIAQTTVTLNLQRAFSDACKSGFVNVLHFLLQQPQQTWNWNQALEFSCSTSSYLSGMKIPKWVQTRRSEIIKLLIQNGASQHYNYVLYFASCYGDVDLVNFIVSKGANNFDDAFAQACLNKHLNVAQRLLPFVTTLGKTRISNGKVLFPKRAGIDKYWLKIDTNLEIAKLIINNSHEPIECFTENDLYMMLENGFSIHKFSDNTQIRVKIQEMHKTIQKQNAFVNNDMLTLICEYSLF